MLQSQENSIVERESCLFSTTHFKYLVKPDAQSVHDYFMKQKASTWSLQNYIGHVLDNLEKELVDFDQAYSIFTDSLDKTNQIVNILLPIKSFCRNYLKWLKSCAGIATIGACCNFFDVKKMQSQSFKLHDTVETTICLNAKMEVFQCHLQSSGSLPSPKSPSQIYRELTHLISTPNK
ncbi:8753_t:CDS:2 [Funneliformis geosporum]|uniref:8753_t:CDS:1 n=1 Tax=Funneliformis geosporum TaxID=1117311 RepID=A0A9W4SV33_9GLOM|nr:8753_t:CDS:2 [Funneliformis geosporum]